MSALYPVSINLNVNSDDIETYQVLTDMYFKGVIEGQAFISVTAKGTQLLFTHDQDVTYVELDNSILEDYKRSVTTLVKKLNNSIFESAYLNTNTVNNGHYYIGDNSISANGLSANLHNSSNASMKNPNSGTA